MTLKELRALVRERLDDEAAPYLWSDDAIRDALNEAEGEAAERARLLRDDSSDLTRLTVEAGVASYELDERIVGIERVFSTGMVRALRPSTREKLDGSCGARWEDHDGTPQSWFDEQAYLRLYPKPVAGDTLILSLWRRPLEPMQDDGDEPEIAARYHVRMIDWALHLLYLRRDADTQDLGLAKQYDESFTASFGIRVDANVQRKQRLKKVPVVRPQW